MSHNDIFTPHATHHASNPATNHGSLLLSTSGSVTVSGEATNLIERFNRELRRRLRPAGAMQTENEAWKIVWAVSTEQEKRWNRRRVHGAKELALAA